MKRTEGIAPYVWIVVKDTPEKYDPRTAKIDYVAEVVDAVRFENMLRKQNKRAYRARSYGEYFPGWENQRRQYF